MEPNLIVPSSNRVSLEAKLALITAVLGLIAAAIPISHELFASDPKPERKDPPAVVAEGGTTKGDAPIVPPAEKADPDRVVGRRVGAQGRHVRLDGVSTNSCGRPAAAGRGSTRRSA